MSLTFSFFFFFSHGTWMLQLAEQSRKRCASFSEESSCIRKVTQVVTLNANFLKKTVIKLKLKIKFLPKKQCSILKNTDLKCFVLMSGFNYKSFWYFWNMLFLLLTWAKLMSGSGTGSGRGCSVQGRPSKAKAVRICHGYINCFITLTLTFI